MPKVQVYLPADLHAAMTRLALVPSHLLQDAVRFEVAEAERRQAARELIAHLDARHGPPSARGLAAGRAWAAGITNHFEAVAAGAAPAGEAGPGRRPRPPRRAR